MGFPEVIAGSGFPFPACKLFAVMGWERVIGVKAPHRENRYIYKLIGIAYCFASATPQESRTARPGITGHLSIRPLI